MSADFLVEIGTEELPPKALLKLADAFRDHILNSLQNVDLEHGEAKLFAAPRRIGLLVKDVAEATRAKEIVKWGPPAKVAFDKEGNPTKAGEAFAKKNSLDVAALSSLVENDGTQDKLCHRAVEDGVATASLLTAMVNEALAALPIPKRMRWGAKRDEFVRPVHWILMLFGNDVVEGKVLSLEAGRTSRGHRFHSSGEVSISTPGAYAEALRSAYVIADFEERRELIRQGVDAAAKGTGGTAVIDPALLDEVTALNEWPVPLIGNFEARFLDVPPEALISSMKEHQKYFHVVDSDGKLMPLFITIANIESREPARVVAGNEKVIRPRLSDAAFFYETDKKKTLAERRQQLKSIVFQEQLGTVYDKTQRIARLGAYLAPFTGAAENNATRAGELCKSDLVSEMVLEFDDLQGLMGRYYAIHDGEDPDVAAALYEHYLPQFAGDRLPESTTGTAIALADRLDTLVGIFGIGQPPTGSRDPFALRRASLGILRIIVEKSLDLPLKPAIEQAISLHTGLTVTEGLSEQVLTYLFERFRAWYEDEGISAEVFMSVLAKQLDNPLDFDMRIQAVNQFNQLPEASALAAANKRVSNILAKSEDDLSGEIDQGLFEKDEETALLAAVTSLSKAVSPLFKARQYSQAMQDLAQLKEPVDAFFDEVMVMAEDVAIRSNRLKLLSELRTLFLEVADISLLVPAK